MLPDMPDLTALMQQCAPNVGIVTMRALIKTESSGNPFILADAGPRHLPWSKRKHLVRTLRPKSASEAAAAVRDLVSRGHIAAIGLTQVHVDNVRRMGLTVEQVLDPCTNIQTGAKILTDYYDKAVRKLGNGDEQAALQVALSLYWSNDYVRGFEGGYVAKVMHNAGLPVTLKVPSLAVGSVLPTPYGKLRVDRGSRIAAYTAPLDAWGQDGQAGGSHQKIKFDPRSAPLAVAGFGQATE